MFISTASGTNSEFVYGRNLGEGNLFEMETSWPCSAYLEWQPLGTVKGIFSFNFFFFGSVYFKDVNCYG